MKITQRLEINQNMTRSIVKDSTLIKQKINKIGNQSEAMKLSIKDYQNLTERRLDDLDNRTKLSAAVTGQRIDSFENKTAFYIAVTDQRVDALENKAKVYDAATNRRLDDLENKTRLYEQLISNITDGRHHPGNCVCVCACVCMYKLA